ncbi:MAG: recombinase family protein [Eubacteriales bacterium]|nr:recombinase family protein [Eubacteriales bacterium]
MRVAIYTRVSTGMQVDGFSLDAQRNTLTEKCEKEGWEIVEIYTDAGISGKDLDHRPAVQRLLLDAKLHKFDMVLVWSLSRFTRSVADLYDTCNLLNKNNISLVSLTEAFDTATPTGRAMMGMLGVFAQMEREITSERVKAALLERASQGKRTCTEVLGYDLHGDSLTINVNEAKMIRYIFNKYEEYENLSAVAELCQLRGYTGKRGRQQCAWTIKTILTRPIYAGFNFYNGMIFPGHHEPIISVQQYNRVQKLLTKNQIGRKRETFTFLPEK